MSGLNYLVQKLKKVNKDEEEPEAHANCEINNQMALDMSKDFTYSLKRKKLKNL